MRDCEDKKQRQQINTVINDIEARLRSVAKEELDSSIEVSECADIGMSSCGYTRMSQCEYVYMSECEDEDMSQCINEPMEGQKQKKDS